MSSVRYFTSDVASSAWTRLGDATEREGGNITAPIMALVVIMVAMAMSINAATAAQKSRLAIMIVILAILGILVLPALTFYHK
jgi:hypothetical protein